MPSICGRRFCPHEHGAYQTVEKGDWLADRLKNRLSFKW
jgi:hypothetical protein